MDEQKMRRRDFLLATSIGAGSFLIGTRTAGAVDSIARLGDATATVQPSQLVRREFGTLTTGQVAALRNGVRVMQLRATSNPRSWTYQAAMHGTPTTPPRPAWNTCEHGHFLFFAWHRLYLHYFERILRQAIGTAWPTFALPYWNYAIATNRALPAPFRTPTSGNPLFVAARNPTMNAGGLLPAVDVTAATAMTRTGFVPASGAPARLSFGGGVVAAPTHFGSAYGQLELLPHNLVHVDIGGWMSDPNSAARDPIFWLHHANIDRLWQSWLSLGGGRVNPNPAVFPQLGTIRWTFFNETGAAVTHKPSDAFTLVPTYDTLTPFASAGGARELASSDPGAGVEASATEQDQEGEVRPILPASVAGIRVSAVPTAAARSERALSLSGGRTTAALRVPQASRQAFEARPAVAERWVLTLDGLSVDRPPGGSYDVYLNLPASTLPGGRAVREYVGTVDFFALYSHTAHSGRPGRLRNIALAIDVTDVVERLREARLWNADSVTASFVFRGPTLPGRSADSARPEVPTRVAVVTVRRQ